MKRLTVQQGQAWAGFFFVLPTLVLWLVWIAWPAAYSLYLSLREWELLGEGRFVGLDNYRELATDPLFWQVLAQTLLYTALNTAGGVGLGLWLALLIDRSLSWRGVWSTLFFLPVITPMVVAAILWRWLYHPGSGLLNLLLHLLGWPGLGWLQDTRLVLPSVAAMAVWKNLGMAIVVYLAGLRTIPGELYEAAAIDGCSRLQSTWHLTLPLLRPTILFVSVTSMLTSFQGFTEVFVMTEGGPLQASTLLALHLYRSGFVFLRMGYAAALGVVMGGLMLAMTILQLRLMPQEASR